MKLITIHVPERYLRELDRLVESKYYHSRADAIRSAVRDLLMKERDILEYR
ncbi:ribbon-helix-helix protein, CopG family [Candidatus Bathyarchaeota archaeon]|nr:ribbon-helix-helix protein, CopG family [Candidatus Bathyarchaeota archaeon]